MAEITLESVSKVYPDGTEAVSGLDLEIGDGEFMVFVGPSGCGKTTALRMIAGLEDITRGTIRIGEKVVNDLAPRDRDVAMVFQNYALYPHMTVAENMGFGLKLQKVPKQEIERRVQEAARILGLEQFLERKPRALSGGQRQRVAMGRAIVREPHAFLMDEPLSNLDAKLRVQMRAEVSRIQRDLKVTTVYVTHDQVEAMTMGERVAVMRKGVLNQVGPPQELYDRPVNVFVGGFIGSPAMNMVESKLQQVDGQIQATVGTARLTVDPSVFERRPSLRKYLDRPVVMGIRPEDMEDASIARESPADRRLKVTVNLAEAMGSEVYVHFGVDAPPVVTEDTKELAADVGGEALDQLELAASGGEADFTARFSARTKVREGDQTEIAIDTRNLHFFDIEKGTGIYDGEAPRVRGG